MSCGSTIRAFVAVPIPEHIRAELARMQTEMLPEFRDVSWTRPEAMHLTLHFFGDIDTEKINEVIATLTAATGSRPVMKLSLRGVGNFSQRVIWAGIEGDIEILRELALAIQDSVAKFGSKIEERRFNAHVTLGRVRQRAGRDFNVKLQRWREAEFGSFSADRVELIRSELSPHGSRYTTLAVFPLIG
ncbi:MAG TPA: RNA 2',3'-cyclic phosphodiesterase [Candidatus Acidoferrum sp.]|nr:RNA 2',3'-cyclic phosphodiesterase [Candidatus Acidoferrum sp.]